MTRILAAFLLVILVPQGVDAFSHGLNTTWNGSLLGGGWVCFQAQITGCSQGFNAACDGVTDDKTAWNNFMTYASGVSDAKLYIPPGANCINSAGFSTAIPNASLHVDGIKVPKLTLWAYGASFDTLFFGIVGQIFPDNTHNALVQTATAGTGTLTLVNSGDASKFSIGSWIIVCGLELQTFGYPPNWSVFEYHQVTGVSGSVITLDNALSYSYKSTWPQADVGGANTVNLGGPASAYVLNVAWDQDLTIYGLRVKQSTQVSGGGRSVTLNSMSFDSVNGPAPSVAKTFTINNSNVRSPEFDKLVDTLTLQNITGSQLIFQSGSFNHVQMTNVNVSQLNGTTPGMVISNLTTPLVNIGPLGYGHGTSFSIINSVVSAANFINICMTPSWMTFSSGTFTLPKSPDHSDNLFAWAVPGQKYYFASGSGSNVSTPHSQFTISDLREDATNYYVDTDIAGALPTPTCFGMACTCYTAYQASSVTQTNTGPADLTPAAP